MENPLERIMELGRRNKEAWRRTLIERQIVVLEAKIRALGGNPMFMDRTRQFRLMSKIKRLKRELAQPSLFG